MRHTFSNRSRNAGVRQIATEIIEDPYALQTEKADKKIISFSIDTIDSETVSISATSPV